MTRVVALGSAFLALVAWASCATAEEAKAPVSAAMILNLVAQPIALRESPLEQAAREPGPPPRPATLPVVSITVKNPCPPGTAHYEPPSLPGRRR